MSGRPQLWAHTLASQPCRSEASLRRRAERGYLRIQPITMKKRRQASFSKMLSRLNKKEQKLITWNLETKNIHH